MNWYGIKHFLNTKDVTIRFALHNHILNYEKLQRTSIYLEFFRELPFIIYQGCVTISHYIQSRLVRNDDQST